MPDVFHTGDTDNKLYLVSGEFSSTLKSSLSIAAVDAVPSGVAWDGTNTLWSGNSADKLYLQSGAFASTLKTSIAAPSGTGTNGISYLETGDTQYLTTVPNDKIFVVSGQYTSTIKTSQVLASLDSAVFGENSDGTDTMIAGATNDKLYLLSGRFSLTIKDSVSIAALSTTPLGVTWNGTDSIYCDPVTDKLYKLSGKFTSTLKTSISVVTYETFIDGADTSDVSARLNLNPAQPTLVSSVSKKRIMPYASGKIVHGKLPLADHTTATVISWEDINGNAYTPAIGDRFVLTDVHITNATGSNTCTLFQDLDAGNDNDAGEPILTAEFTGQGTWSQSFTLPHATAKLSVASHDIHFISTAAGQTSVLLHAFIIRT